VEEKYKLWRIWSKGLHHLGLHEFAASMLEAGDPVNVILAQLVYVLQPIFQPGKSNGSLTVLAETLEDRSETQLFVSLLREGVEA
jgi:hypothetical protein